MVLCQLQASIGSCDPLRTVHGSIFLFRGNQGARTWKRMAERWRFAFAELMMFFLRGVGDASAALYECAGGPCPADI